MPPLDDLFLDLLFLLAIVAIHEGQRFHQHRQEYRYLRYLVHLDLKPPLQKVETQV